MVKSGNKEVEEEVIRTSRELYCRSKEDIEREINAWSGMSLGNDNDTGSMEKFLAVCSSCKKETTVPFKPEPGRPVYCKDCVAKIKAGELKPVKGAENQIRQDDAKFFKPLADLGIEFAPRSSTNDEEQSRHLERVNPVVQPRQAPVFTPPKTIAPSAAPQPKPGILSSIKKAFTTNPAPERPIHIAPKPPAMHQPMRKLAENPALKEILNKTLSSQPSTPKPQTAQPGVVVEPSPPKPVSLDSLRQKTADVVKSTTMNLSRDRGASPQEMDKLKNFISEKAPHKPVPPVYAATPAPIVPPKPLAASIPPTPPPIKKMDDMKQPETPQPVQAKTVKEVPESILRRLLE